MFLLPILGHKSVRTETAVKHVLAALVVVIVSLALTGVLLAAVWLMNKLWPQDDVHEE